jgi:hypothetical protein
MHGRTDNQTQWHWPIILSYQKLRSLLCWPDFFSLIFWSSEVRWSGEFGCQNCWQCITMMIGWYHIIVLIQSSVLPRELHHPSCEAQCRTGCESWVPLEPLQGSGDSAKYDDYLFLRLFDIPCFRPFSLFFNQSSPLRICAGAQNDGRPHSHAVTASSSYIWEHVTYIETLLWALSLGFPFCRVMK